METQKRLRRSKERMVGGVCGGFADYFNLDPTLVRVAYVVLTLCTAFSGILLYIIMLIVMPSEGFEEKR